MAQQHGPSGQILTNGVSSAGPLASMMHMRQQHRLPSEIVPDSTVRKFHVAIAEYYQKNGYNASYQSLLQDTTITDDEVKSTEAQNLFEWYVLFVHIAAAKRGETSETTEDAILYAEIVKHKNVQHARLRDNLRRSQEESIRQGQGLNAGFGHHPVAVGQIPAGYSMHPSQMAQHPQGPPISNLPVLGGPPQQQPHPVPSSQPPFGHPVGPQHSLTAAQAGQPQGHNLGMQSQQQQAQQQQAQQQHAQQQQAQQQAAQQQQAQQQQQQAQQQQGQQQQSQQQQQQPQSQQQLQMQQQQPPHLQQQGRMQLQGIPPQHAQMQQGRPASQQLPTQSGQPPNATPSLPQYHQSPVVHPGRVAQQQPYSQQQMQQPQPPQPQPQSTPQQSQQQMQMAMGTPKRTPSQSFQMLNRPGSGDHPATNAGSPSGIVRPPSHASSQPPAPPAHPQIQSFNPQQPQQGFPQQPGPQQPQQHPSHPGQRPQYYTGMVNMGMGLTIPGIGQPQTYEQSIKELGLEGDFSSLSNEEKMGVMAHTQRASQNNAQVAYMMGMNGMTPAPQQAQRQIAGRPGGLGIGVAQNMMQTVMPGGPGQGQMAHFTGRPMPSNINGAPGPLPPQMMISQHQLPPSGPSAQQVGLKRPSSTEEMSSQEVSPPNKKQKRQVSGDRGRPGTANGNSNSNGAGPSNGSAPAGAVLPPGYAQGAPLPGNPTPNGMGRPPPPGGQIMMPAQRPIQQFRREDPRLLNQLSILAQQQQPKHSGMPPPPTPAQGQSQHPQPAASPASGDARTPGPNRGGPMGKGNMMPPPQSPASSANKNNAGPGNTASGDGGKDKGKDSAGRPLDGSGKSSPGNGGPTPGSTGPNPTPTPGPMTHSSTTLSPATLLGQNSFSPHSLSRPNSTNTVPSSNAPTHQAPPSEYSFDSTISPDELLRQFGDPSQFGMLGNSGLNLGGGGGLGAFATGGDTLMNHSADGLELDFDLERAFATYIEDPANTANTQTATS